jgi:crotonobetainyl-CoA:carnitine CoA-transferase CaiB-like acyl-CoA transferase
VQTIAQALTMDYADEIGLVQSHPHPSGRDIRMIGSPIRLNGERVNATQAAPGLGQHTDALLAELGYDSDAIGTMRRNGTI